MQPARGTEPLHGTGAFVPLPHVEARCRAGKQIRRHAFFLGCGRNCGAHRFCPLAWAVERLLCCGLYGGPRGGGRRNFPELIVTNLLSFCGTPLAQLL